MARVYSASQFEQNFLPHRLGNWQMSPGLENKFGTAPTRYSTLQGPKQRSTQFIADSKGHLQAGVKKVGNAFRLKLGPADAAPTRWPKPLLTIKAAPSATMGYKGLPLAVTAPVKGGNYPGVVATRLPRKGAGAAGAAVKGGAAAGTRPAGSNSQQ